MSKFYAGIGSRHTPIAIQFIMIHIGMEMAKRGFILRSGAADGADMAFERGCDRANGTKEIFIPWDGFNKRYPHQTGVITGTSEAHEQVAAKFHPNWGACSSGARTLHSRNVAQVLGTDLVSPARMVLCWTPNADGSGGTGQAIRIAKAHDVPVYDLGDEQTLTLILKDLNLV